VLSESAYGQHQCAGFVSLENSHNVCGGTVLTPEYTVAMAALAHRHGARLFLDGARVLNSAVSLNVRVSELTAPADAVVISLNKGLGAPLGAVLCSGGAFIERARDVARQTGMAAVHRGGIFAAAALVALDGMVEQLADDHRRARMLAHELNELDGLDVDLETVQTNLVRVTTHALGVSALEVARRAAGRGLAIHVMDPDAFKLAVCYAINDEKVEEAVGILGRVIDELA
jgi:threonine aldolase